MSATGDFNHIPAVIEALQSGAKKAVTKAALDVEGQAKRLAPVDTGFLRASIYTVTADSSGYDTARLGTSSNTRRGESQAMLPEVGKPASETEAIVAVGAAYAAYVEYGTRHMRAQPFLHPALDAVKGSLQAALARVVAAEIKSKLGGGGGG